MDVEVDVAGTPIGVGRAEFSDRLVVADAPGKGEVVAGCGDDEFVGRRRTVEGAVGDLGDEPAPQERLLQVQPLAGLGEGHAAGRSEQLVVTHRAIEIEPAILKGDLPSQPLRLEIQRPACRRLRSLLFFLRGKQTRSS